MNCKTKAWTPSRPNESLGFAADARDYDFPAEILKNLGARQIPSALQQSRKMRQLEAAGFVLSSVFVPPRTSKFRHLPAKPKEKDGSLADGV